MAYTVLARRYRSNTFDEVVGQSHIAQTLKKAIESGRIAHAYLFCGTRGTGKTSTARILAKCLNCQSADHPVTAPCGKCVSCTAIARGEDLDVVEIDAASNTGVDNVRDIIGNSQYTPAHSRFKVYIIDEVHMLSKSAFNALLKTLEEPPSHVKFILATTEPEKVLATILSRCQRYDFRNIPTREIAGHLKEICEKEEISADDDALLLVAKAGAGSMRDSLSLLDRLLSVGEKQLSVDLIEQMLGLPKSQLIFDLCDAIGKGDVKATLTQADAIVSGGLSVDSLVASIIDHIRNLLVIRTCGMESNLVEVPGLSPAELKRQAELFDPGAVTQDIVILEELRRHVRQSQAGRALLDATLVRMALADQFSSIGDLVSQAGGRAASPVQKKKFEGVSRMAPSPGTPGEGGGEGDFELQKPLDKPNHPHPSPLPAYRERGPETPPADEPVDFSNIDVGDDLPAVGRVWEGEKKSLGSILKQHASPPKLATPEPSNIQPINSGDLSQKWKDLLALVADSAGLHGILSHGRLVAIEDGKAVVRYSKSNESMLRMLERNGKKDAVRDALGKVLNQPVGVKFELDEAVVSETENAKPQAARPAASASAVPSARPMTPAAPSMPAAPRLTPEQKDALRKDPLIAKVLQTFGGDVIKWEE